MGKWNRDRCGEIDQRYCRRVEMDKRYCTVDVGKLNRWLQRVHFTEERRITGECECTDDIQNRRGVVLPSLRDLTLEVLPTGAC